MTERNCTPYSPMIFQQTTPSLHTHTNRASIRKHAKKLSTHGKHTGENHAPHNRRPSSSRRRWAGTSHSPSFKRLAIGLASNSRLSSVSEYVYDHTHPYRGMLCPLLATCHIIAACSLHDAVKQQLLRRRRSDSSCPSRTFHSKEGRNVWAPS